MGPQVRKIWTICPHCSHTRHKTHLKCMAQTLSKSTGKVLQQCFHCGFRGTVDEVNVPFTQPTQPVEVVDYNRNPMSDAGILYLMRRKIPLSVIMHHNVNTKGIEIYFGYEKGSKVRSIVNKRFRCTERLEGVFGNVNVNLPYIFFFEGEIDALTGFTLGIRNSVSVPYGSGSFRTTDTAAYLKWAGKTFKTVVIGHDDDTPGLIMCSDALLQLRGLPADVVTLEYGGFKDINEMVCKSNGQEISEWVRKFIHPITG